MKHSRILALCAALASLTACGTGAVPAAAPEKTPEVTEMTEASETQTAQPETTLPETICTTETEAPAETQPAAELTGDFPKAQTAFSLELLRQVLNSGEENVLVSPYSVSIALAMAECGAAGETRSCMEQVFGMEADAYCSSLGGFAQAAEGQTLHTANSVWMKQTPDFSVKDAYLQRLSDCFGAESFTEPFDGGTVQKVNNWVKEQTNGMIPSIIQQFQPNDRMVLVNAAAFESKWKERYKEKDILEGRKFRNADGSETETDMMRSKEKQYLSGDGVTGFLKPYESGFLFAAFLPDEGSPAEWLSGLDAETLREMLTNPQHREVRTFMPPFTFDYSKELTEALCSAGMAPAFTAGADFSGMSDTDLQIGQVVHKTHIEVDAEGTKAAAATAVGLTTNAVLVEDQPLTVALNRPFAYMILDEETKLPLFIGTVDTLPETD